jgi:hypothetical protein
VPDVATIYRQVRVMGIPRGDVVAASNGHHSNGNADPLAAALLRQRQVVADRVDEQAARQIEGQASLETRKLELEARKLELEEAATEAKLVQLRTQLAEIGRKGDDGGAGFQGLLALLQGQREESKEDRLALLTIINEQMEAARQPATVAEPQPSGTVADRITELVALRAAMEKLFPPPPPSPGVSPHQMIELEKMRLDVEFQRAKLAEESADRVRRSQREELRLNQEMEVKREVVRAEMDRNGRLAQLIEQLGPAAIAAFTQRNEPGAGGPAALPSEPPMSERRCTACGSAYLVRPDATVVVCPHCHIYQDVTAPAPTD